MTDLTTTISTILTETHKSSPLPIHITLHKTLDTFLNEATQINRSITQLTTYLLSIRQPYLSTAPPPRRSQRNTTPSLTSTTPQIPTHLTDPQRNEIDASTSTLLQSLASSLTNLRDALSLRHSNAETRLDAQYQRKNRAKSFLTRWAGGDTDSTDAGKTDAQIHDEGVERTLHQHREGVLWFLENRLNGALSKQQEMLRIRAEREREKRASVLWDETNRNVKARNSQTATSQAMDDSTTSLHPDSATLSSTDFRDPTPYDPSLDPSSQPSEPQLSEAQLALLTEESHLLMSHFTSTLAQTTKAEQSLLEISSLQQQLLGHLNVQQEYIGQLVEDAERTDENVGRGNKELKKATERTRTARAVFWGTVWVCGGLVVWDLIF